MEEKPISPIDFKNIPEGWEKVDLGNSLEDKAKQLDKRVNKVVCIVYQLEKDIKNYVGVLDSFVTKIYQISDPADDLEFEFIEVDKIKELYMDLKQYLPE